ncbi:MAG: DUF5714 domain-containing protein [Lachnospiraceae bacterium]|nr:DUF5714 domain-containing protein [Lachnospiraceae bacterium]
MAGHEIVLEESVNEAIKEICMGYFREGKADAFALLQDLMDLEGVPMHYPYHHYIVPMVLLTTVRTMEKSEEEILSQDLDTAIERGQNILGGFCGFYGNCGAAVGVGVFYSIYAGIVPTSRKGWAACNKATADALLKISEIEGPRCCKRNSFLALYSAADTIKERFGIEIACPEAVVCKYHDRNKECKRKACPYFKEEETC